MVENFFEYRRHFSVMQLLLELGLSSWNTLIIDSQSVFVKSWQNCDNRLVSCACYVYNCVFSMFLCVRTQGVYVCVCFILSFLFFLHFSLINFYCVFRHLFAVYFSSMYSRCDLSTGIFIRIYGYGYMDFCHMDLVSELNLMIMMMITQCHRLSRSQR